MPYIKEFLEILKRVRNTSRILHQENFESWVLGDIREIEHDTVQTIEELKKVLGKIGEVL